MVKTRNAALVLAGLWFVGCAAAPTPDDPVQRLGLVPSFADEFSGRAVDPKKWNTGRNSDSVAVRSLSNNGEHQIYLNPGYLGIDEQPLTVADGKLTITAKPLTPAQRSVVQAAVRALPLAQANSALKDIAYGSGALNSNAHFSQLYGYFEIRARFPEGRGLWPAFWLLPRDGAWPPEIDVVEELGHEPNTIYQTLHSNAPIKSGNVYRLTPSADGFHRYGALWTSKTVDFYVDGAKVASEPTPPDMHKPMFLVANLAVGGNWPGYPDAGTNFPAKMEIDYIRAWKFKRKPV